MSDPAIWAVRDQRCGHDFTATRIREQLEPVLEVGGPLFPDAFLVHPVDDAADYNPKREDCATCDERQKQLLIGVFRPALREWTEKQGADPAAAIRLYDDLIALGHSPHAANHAVQKTVAMGRLIALEFTVPDADDPRWSS